MTLDQIDLADIYRTFHPKTAEHTFFSSAHKAFSRIDHMATEQDSVNFRRLKSYQALLPTTTV